VQVQWCSNKHSEEKWSNERKITADEGVRGAHSELEEPVVPGVAALSLEHKASIPNEGVAIVATVSKRVANKVEADSSDGSIKQGHEHDTSGVFMLQGSRGKLQAQGQDTR
jgi:hypothetical protein